MTWLDAAKALISIVALSLNFYCWSRMWDAMVERGVSERARFGK